MGLTDFTNAKPYELSGELKQRVALALALGSRVVVLSPRPGQIIGMFDAMFSQPLSGTAEDDTIRASNEYMFMRRRILDLINGVK